MKTNSCMKLIKKKLVEQEAFVKRVWENHGTTR